MTAIPNNLQMLSNVSVSVSVELGRTELPLRDVLAFTEDSIVALNRQTDELLDVMVNGRQIAKAEVTTQDNRFALRIVEMVSEGVGNRPAPEPTPDPTSLAKPGTAAS